MTENRGPTGGPGGSYRDLAVKLRMESLSNVVTASSAVLALLVTFRNNLLHGVVAADWSIKVAWASFAMAVVLAVASKWLSASVALALAEGKDKGVLEKDKLSDHVSNWAMTAFAVGVVSLVIFGLANLGSTASP